MILVKSKRHHFPHVFMLRSGSRCRPIWGGHPTRWTRTDERCKITLPSVLVTLLLLKLPDGRTLHATFVTSLFAQILAGKHCVSLILEEV